MNASLCRRRTDMFHSVESVIRVLQNDWGRCDGCVNGEVLDLLTKQFRLRAPRWWVVDGAVIVPIWIVEKLKNYPELMAHSSTRQTGYSRMRLDAAAFQH